MEFEFQSEMVSQVKFSNLSYNLLLTSSGRVYEMGYSSVYDVPNTKPNNSLSNHKIFEQSPDLKKQNKKFLRPVSYLDSKIIT